MAIAIIIEANVSEIKMLPSFKYTKISMKYLRILSITIEFLNSMIHHCIQRKTNLSEDNQTIFLSKVSISCCHNTT